MDTVGLGELVNVTSVEAVVVPAAFVAVAV
jgi:hypothetical protein